MALKDPVKRREYHRAWTSRNKDKVRSYESTVTLEQRQRAQKKYRRIHPDRARVSGQLSRLRKDGVPEHQIEIAKYALAIFEGRCFVCKNTSTHKKGFALDHDHRTKKFRGIVCSHCNSAMGLVGDDPARLRLLAEWIESHRG